MTRRTVEYLAYYNMRSRCLNEKHGKYKNYGARGIKICERWLSSVDNFLLDMGKKPSRFHTLHRLDNDGPYSPDNCIWATNRVQARNKTTTKWIAYKGEVLPLVEWAERLQIPYSVLAARLGLGWAVEKAFARRRFRDEKLAYKGQEMTLGEWAAMLGIKYATLLYRFHKAASLDVVFSGDRMYRGEHCHGCTYNRSGTNT